MPVLPTMGFTAMMLRKGETARPPRRSSSAVFHVIEGSGRSTVNGEAFTWKRGDTFSAPVFASIDHAQTGGEPAFLVRIHDAPLQHKLGFYEERERA
jgi:gentisate 1,2-dioxygenase